AEPTHLFAVQHRQGSIYFTGSNSPSGIAITSPPLFDLLACRWAVFSPGGDCSWSGELADSPLKAPEVLCLPEMEQFLWISTRTHSSIRTEWAVHRPLRDVYLCNRGWNCRGRVRRSLSDASLPQQSVLVGSSGHTDHTCSSESDSSCRRGGICGSRRGAAGRLSGCHRNFCFGAACGSLDLLLAGQSALGRRKPCFLNQRASNAWKLSDYSYRNHRVLLGINERDSDRRSARLCSLGPI